MSRRFFPGFLRERHWEAPSPYLFVIKTIVMKTTITLKTFTGQAMQTGPGKRNMVFGIIGAEAVVLAGKLWAELLPGL
jgi:hypothetical protein